ncbi:MAG TPA: hypothetical protein VGA51_14335 [Casimicrobiaceae bacterium]
MMSLLVGCCSSAVYAQTAVTLMHVHGLSYSPDGKRLMIPSHHGLAVYENGHWSKAPGPQHDYMGFAASAKGLYSSGHPAPESGLVNPFGLIRSGDDGKTWQKLGLEGETDFHLLATSWNAHAIYVWNPASSSRIKRPGLHSTMNEGFAWKPARAAGLEGEPRALAVHPNDATIVAVATSKGVSHRAIPERPFDASPPARARQCFSISMASGSGSARSTAKRVLLKQTSAATRSSRSQFRCCKGTQSRTSPRIR